jgi:putative ABC transport system ATP-binding protein
MTLAFKLTEVRKSYSLGDRQLEILHGINIEIEAGSYVAIMGPSGSGKSTLMQLLGCLDVPTNGAISVMGQSISELNDDEISQFRSKMLGFIFQGFHLLPAYDALSNVTMAASYSGRPGGIERSRQLLHDFGLGHRLSHRPRMLSGGEQQRVAIARALVNDPPIILADEPTGALDQTNGQAVLKVFEDLHRSGKTIILVTHDAAVARHAHRVIEIVDGAVKYDGRSR